MEAQRFGARLRQLRKQAGLSQRELADRVGIDFTYLSKIENGVMPPPSERVILQLAEVLSADKDELLTLAARLPSDLSQLLSKRQALRLLRSVQRGEKLLAASSKKRQSLQTSGKNFFKKYGSLKNYGKLSRVAVAAILVCAVAASLWYAAPARALTIDITAPASAALGSSVSFSAQVNVQDGDVLPIKSVDLEIFKPGTSDKFVGLPLVTVSGVPYTGTPFGSTATISAVTGAGWGYGYGSPRGGYGYGYGIGWGYHWVSGYTFGYGYAPPGTGATSITYNVAWNVPSNWPTGSYTIRLWVNANGVSFVQDATLTLTEAVVGGGGGGEGPAPAAPGTTDVSDAVDPETGEFTETVTAESEDGNVEVTIEEGIIGKTKEGESISDITIVPMADPPDAPADSNVIGLTYDIGPDGATFDGDITLTFTYDEALLPDDVDEANLVIAMWVVDEATGEGAWVELDCVVDTEANTITFSLNHLTVFTILAYTRPAAFAASDLSITPAAVGIGETVTISVLVTNTGDLTDSYEVTLEIDNVVVSTEEVTLIGHASQKVTFTTSRDVAATYTVTVDGLSKTFTVEAPAAFVASDLSVTPAAVGIGETVTISVLVTNTGDLTDSYEVTLKIDNVVVSTEEVTLAGGASQKVTFTTSKDVAGTYTVNVNGQIKSFTVTEVVKPGIAWWLWLIIGVVGAIIVGFAVWMVIRRREA